METMGAIRLRGRERIEEVWTPRELGTEGVRMEEALTLAGQGVRAYREGRLDDAQGTFERLNADPSFGRLAGVYLLAITANRAKMRSGRPENGGPTVAPAEFDGTIDVTDV